MNITRCDGAASVGSTADATNNNEKMEEVTSSSFPPLIMRKEQSTGSRNQN